MSTEQPRSTADALTRRAILGTALAAATGDAFLGFAAILVAFLFKLRREEALLTREFGDEYVQFRRDTAALVPGVF